MMETINKDKLMTLWEKIVKRLPQETVEHLLKIMTDPDLSSERVVAEILGIDHIREIIKEAEAEMNGEEKRKNGEQS